MTAGMLRGVRVTGFSYDARIYDLAVCSSASTSGRTIATGCGRRDIKAQVSNNGSVDTITRLYFDEQGKVLTYFAHTGQQWLKKPW